MHVLKDVKAHGLSFTLTCLICMVFQSFTFAHTLKLVTPYRCKTVCCRRQIRCQRKYIEVERIVRKLLL